MAADQIKHASENYWGGLFMLKHWQLFSQHSIMYISFDINEDINIIVVFF